MYNVHRSLVGIVELLMECYFLISLQYHSCYYMKKIIIGNRIKD